MKFSQNKQFIYKYYWLDYLLVVKYKNLLEYFPVFYFFIFYERAINFIFISEMQGNIHIFIYSLFFFSKIKAKLKEMETLNN